MLGLLFYKEAGVIIFGISNFSEEDSCNRIARWEVILVSKSRQLSFEYMSYWGVYYPGIQRVSVLQESPGSPWRLLHEKATYYSAEKEYSLWRETCQVFVCRWFSRIGMGQYTCSLRTAFMHTIPRTSTLRRNAPVYCRLEHKNDCFVEVKADKIVTKDWHVVSLCFRDGLQRYMKQPCKRRFNVISMIEKLQTSLKICIHRATRFHSFVYVSRRCTSLYNELIYQSRRIV